MRRLSILSGVAALALLASPAFAGGAKSGGYPVYAPGPTFNQNLGTAQSNAIGLHNKSKQHIMAQQTGIGGYDHGKGYEGKGYEGKGYSASNWGWPGPMVNSNAGRIESNAIGVGNKSKQDVLAVQTGTPAAAVNSNLGFVQSNAIGLFNESEQKVVGIQQ